MRTIDLPAIAGGRPMFAHPLPIASPESSVTLEFVRDVLAILRSGQYTNASRVRELEDAAAACLRVPHCVAVSSCTSGLILVLKALGIQGSVILPSFTFHATAHSVIWNGCTPVFADCLPGTFCLDPESARARFSKGVAAVIAVHLFGVPAPVAELERLAAEFEVPLIFDAAHAFGSRIHDAPVGGFGAAEVFSLTPTKLLVAGEGGLIATRDPELARQLRVARNYGDAGNYDPEMLGLNARMSEFHASLALRGLGDLAERIERRNRIRLRYQSLLSSVPGLEFQQAPPGARSACKDVSVIVDPALFGESRDWLFQALTRENIGVRRYFDPPVHRQKLYRNLWDGSPLPNTERISSRIVNLPVYSKLTDEQVDLVASAIVRAHHFVKRTSVRTVVAGAVGD